MSDIAGKNIQAVAIAVTANVAATVSFGTYVKNVVIQNNTATIIYRSYTGTANLGDLTIQPGQIISEDVFTTSVSILATVGTSVNAITSGGIVVEGILL